MNVPLRVDNTGGVITATLARPERANALSVGLVTALCELLEAAPQSGARVVVLTGQGDSFCSGGDLDDLEAVAADGPLAVSETIYGYFHRLVELIRKSPLPVIAAVNGPALGAGCDLALLCDLRIASAEAVFASSWVDLGLVPGMSGAHLLADAVGDCRAAEMLLLGERIDATTALAWGLVNRVVAREALSPTVASLASKVAEKSESAVALTKASLRRKTDATLPQELATLGATQGALLTGPDFRSAVDSFRRRSRA